MYLTEPQLTGNAFVDRVIAQRNATHAEIYRLRDELQALNDVLRSKQERLRKMNKAIILRQNSSRYLQLVSAQPVWARVSTDNDFSAEKLSITEGKKPVGFKSY